MLFCLYIFAAAKLESVWRCDAAEITNLNRLIIMEINNIGNNAGILWNVLNANGKMTETKLKKESGLGSAEFYTALGWLARESKINVEVEVKGSKSCEYFSLNA
jgi:hypothetical protein